MLELKILTALVHGSLCGLRSGFKSGEYTTLHMPFEVTSKQRGIILILVCFLEFQLHNNWRQLKVAIVYKFERDIENNSQAQITNPAIFLQDIGNPVSKKHHK